MELAACAVPASKIVKAREVYIVNADTQEKVIVVKENLTSYLLKGAKAILSFSVVLLSCIPKHGAATRLAVVRVVAPTIS